MSNNIPPIWTVYKQPRDYPNSYVARLWHGEKPTDSIVVAPDLESLRELLAEMNLTPIPRWADDDPCIVEVWL
jgi:hypothetical protein